ncbi:hypothetical protein [Herbiconiux sp. L3-i23]|uniref:hypothetical protein n=1 Tax=Herbiconiux sp. L3-i23 TaxID=2905871 RepID=UPI00206A7345|nr:hypothetical protein [Herbiconiux sp. L3-i23]BDI23613.1 hypothetical protein L3i23_23890 [Herbiconiux sp. L3-i23]
MAYPAEKQTPAPSADELRARIPGWGADLDPEDRPSFPRERRDLESGAHWELPPDQPNRAGRERSNEHAELTPVFGTAQPLRGASGAIRRFAYARFSEGRAAHWLLLIAADRVDVVESHSLALLRGRPDNPLTETGVLSEGRRHGIRSRAGRVDVRHSWLDPVLFVAPYVLAGWGLVRIVRAVRARG